MRDSFIPTVWVNVVWLRLLVLLSCLLTSCADRERLPNYRLSGSGSDPLDAASCTVPRQGCPCTVPGSQIACGEVRDETDGYLTCQRGVRLCGDDGTWTACAGNLIKIAAPPHGDKGMLALGVPESCSTINPCDPLCRQIVDTGVAIANPGEGLCATAGGISLCPMCGYAGPTAELPYAEFPKDWKVIPSGCDVAADTCPLDMVCIDGTCRSRTLPCTASNQTCGVDLTLGKPCFDPTDPVHTFHIPLCNRGAQAITGGVIRIGVDSDFAASGRCGSATAASTSDGFPNSGIIDYYLGWGASIAAGSCIDVNWNNSIATGLDLSDNRALVVNYQAAQAECNLCNNGTVMIVSSESGGISTCAGCVNLECSQTNPSTILKGVLYDPAGIHPVPNAMVYVPNAPVAAFVDGVACDTCDSLISGSPIAWTKTDATGQFDLTQVPGDQEFRLVVQLGRWRRIYNVAAVPTGQTRWVNGYSPGLDRLVLTADATQPAPYQDPVQRIRLPATQRRCTAADCAGEGDIPRMALLMGDGDPVQCTLRRIGIADSEFTNVWTPGRVQLFTGVGMVVEDSMTSFGSQGITNSILETGVPELLNYAVLLAPCNASHATIGGEPYATSAYASGPSYNGWPDPTATDRERANVKAFVDAGGRLLTTHWLSTDLVHLNYAAPERARFDGANPVALSSPFDPAGAGSAADFPWVYQALDGYRPNAPAIYYFGANVDAASNLSDSTLGGGYPSLNYQIDTSTALGQTFLTWAAAVGAAAADGALAFANWSPLVRQVHADRGAIALLRGDPRVASNFSTASPDATRAIPVAQQPCVGIDGAPGACSGGSTWGDEHVAMFQFDAPLDSPNKCGRAAVFAGHVSQHDCRAPSAGAQDYCENVPPYDAGNPAPDCGCFTFPSEAERACGSGTTMSREELSFEYLLFSSLQCVGDLKPQAKTTTLPMATYVRDYQADCSEGEIPVWQLLSWQAVVPAGASIEFEVATADTQAGLATADVVGVGTATETTTTWTASNHTIDELFRTHDPTNISRRWLRLSARLVSNLGMSPTLSQWRVVFDCVANE